MMPRKRLVPRKAECVADEIFVAGDATLAQRFASTVWSCPSLMEARMKRIAGITRCRSRRFAMNPPPSIARNHTHTAAMLRAA